MGKHARDGSRPGADGKGAGHSTGLKVFISYSHIDSKLAIDLEERIEALGIPTFRDEKDISIGASVTRRVHEGLDDCLCLVVIVSPASHKSAWIPYEVGHATALHRDIVPWQIHVALQPLPFLHDLKYALNVREVVERVRDIYRSPATIRPGGTREVCSSCEHSEMLSVLRTSRRRLWYSNTWIDKAERQVLADVRDEHQEAIAGAKFDFQVVVASLTDIRSGPSHSLIPAFVHHRLQVTGDPLESIVALHDQLVSDLRSGGKASSKVVRFYAGFMPGLIAVADNDVFFCPSPVDGPNIYHAARGSARRVIYKTEVTGRIGQYWLSQFATMWKGNRMRGRIAGVQHPSLTYTLDQELLQRRRKRPPRSEGVARHDRG